MFSERIHVKSKNLFVRNVADEPAQSSLAGYENSGRSGFLNSTIDRGGFPFADQPNSHDFDVMLAAFMWSGGIARYQEAAIRIEETRNGGPSNLGKLIETRAVFAFEWRGNIWLPMFQFKQPEMYVKPQSREVLAELAGVFDGWSLAGWYLQRNSWLDNRRPIDLLDQHPSAVLSAARGDHYIATH